MTIKGPDLSNYQGGLKIPSGTPFVFGKATEGTSLTDASYRDFKSQAAAIGALFAAYHFLHAGNGAAQAQHAFDVIGPGVPTMIDFEPIKNSSGAYVSKPTIADAVAFRDAFRKLGGLVRLNYFPHWYWQELGSPSLSALSDLALVNSAYPSSGYSDSSTNWNAYGGQSPALWQFTDSQSFGGKLVDFNAFRGSVAQLKSLLSPADPTPAASRKDDDMHFQMESLARNPEGLYMRAIGPGEYKEIAFVIDGFASSAQAKVRVAFDRTGGYAVVNDPLVVSQPSSGHRSVVIAVPADAAGVSLKREDSGAFPVGVYFAEA